MERAMPVSPAIIVLGSLRFKMTLLCVEKASSLVKTALKKSGTGMLYFPTIKAVAKTIAKQRKEMTRYKMVFLFISRAARQSG